jgi:hypothetical protein
MIICPVDCGFAGHDAADDRRIRATLPQSRGRSAMFPAVSFASVGFRLSLRAQSFFQDTPPFLALTSNRSANQCRMRCWPSTRDAPMVHPATRIKKLIKHLDATSEELRAGGDRAPAQRIAGCRNHRAKAFAGAGGSVAGGTALRPTSNHLRALTAMAVVPNGATACA